MGDTARAGRDTRPALNILTGPHVWASSEGELTLRLSCRGDEPAGHRGMVSLKSSGKVSSRYLSRGRSRIVSLGTRRFTAPAGAGANVTLRLSRDNVALLRRMRTMRAVVRVTAIDDAGHVTTARKMLFLHARKPARSG